MSVEIGKVGADKWVDRESCYFDIFCLNSLQQNGVKFFFTVIRQCHCQSFLTFILLQKDVLEMRLVVR